MLLMQLSLFYGNKDSSKYLSPLNTEEHCVSVFILSAQRTTGGSEEGIWWISFQYDGNDNRPMTGAKTS